MGIRKFCWKNWKHSSVLTGIIRRFKKMTISVFLNMFLLKMRNIFLSFY